MNEENKSLKVNEEDLELENDQVIEEELVHDESVEEDKEPKLSPEQLLEIDRIKEEDRIEVERKTEDDRQNKIKERWAKLHDRDIACQQSGISNPKLYFNQLILHNPNKRDAEIKLIELEKKDAFVYAEYVKHYVKENRRLEYQKIDHLLMEALFEKSLGKEDKMEAYLKLRNAIKEKFKK